jgi:MOSC domain-containing protein YiiM
MLGGRASTELESPPMHVAGQIKLLSTNVGQLQPIPWSKSQTPTGIFKLPTGGPVMVHVNGLDGDRIGSKKHHGGPDQAVYLYSAEDYAWWEHRLGRSLPFGIFGENLTVSSLGGRPARVGDVWRIGQVKLELSGPRVPCATLAARMNEPAFVKLFAQANRGGAYARVLTPGVLEAGMDVTVSATGAAYPAIDELFAGWHQRKRDPELLRRALRSPLASRLRDDAEKWLSRLNAEQPEGLFDRV